MPRWMPWSWRVRISSNPVRSPTWASRGYLWPPKFRWRIRPSLVRSKTAPQASSSRTRAGASWAWTWAMRQLLTYCPPRIVSAKWTCQLSRLSTLARAAAMPPSAITVCALPSSDLHTSPTDTPPADASMAARSPAPPAPMTSTSCSCVSYSAICKKPLEESRIGPVACRAHADVEVGEANAEERQPGPQHVLLVEPGHESPRLVAAALLGDVVRAAEAVEPAADQVPQ